MFQPPEGSQVARSAGGGGVHSGRAPGMGAPIAIAAPGETLVTLCMVTF